MIGTRHILTSALLLGVVSSVIACAGEGSTADELSGEKTSAMSLAPGDRRIVAAKVSSEWPGHKLGVSAGVWRDAGTFQLADEDDVFTPPVVDETLPDVPDMNPGSLMMGDPKTRRAYQIDIPQEDLELIGQYMADRGAAEPTETGPNVEDLKDDTSDEIVEKGWSGGVDNRTDRGIAGSGLTTWPYTTIGQMKPNGTAQNADGNCTGTFIGSAGDANTRYIVTAAHCFWSTSTGAYLDPDFWPRQDRCRDNQNANLSSCDQGPYGEWDGGQWLMYTYWTDNCTGQATISALCGANDIAVLRVHRQGDATFPGAIGFTYQDKTFLDGNSKYMRGYPNCGGSGDPNPAAPTVCLSRTLYGDGAFGIGTGDYDDSGYPRRVPFSADVSPGTSGSSGYYYDAGNVYSFGVLSTETCSGSACTGTNVNRMRAITPSWYNSMLTFMGL